MPPRAPVLLSALAALASRPLLAQAPGEERQRPPAVRQWSAKRPIAERQPIRNDLYDLALHTAPILWFSDGEPLLWQPSEPKAIERDFASVPKTPQALPCDPLGPAQPVVYFRLDRVQTQRTLSEAERRGIAAGRLPLEAMRRLRLNYYFYYPRDEGTNPHIHDVESISVELDVERGRDGQVRIEPSRVTGWGHGSELLANILQIKPSFRNVRGAPDVRLPVTILVEEGKHASCPDRGGDGQYTPGVDVNVRVRDAWGVRDVFGSGVLGSRYSAFMTKSRLKPTQPALLADGDTGPVPVDRYRIGPPLAVDDPVRVRYEQERLLNGGVGYPAATYELRDATSVRSCEVEPPLDLETGRPLAWETQGHIFKAACPAAPLAAGEDAEAAGARRRCGYLNLPASAAENFAPPSVVSGRLRYHYGDWWPLQPFRMSFVGARYDRGAFGVTAGLYLGYGLPKFGGWFDLGATAVRRDERWDWTANAWYTPAIANLAEWYVGVGYDFGAGDGRFAVEGGIQVRYQAVGLRLGVRSGLSRGGLSDAGLVSELVLGPLPRASRVH
jgi:hypothetical protein